MRKLNVFGKNLSKEEQKQFSGGYDPQCCTLYCMDYNHTVVGTVSVSETCPVDAFDICCHFYSTTAMVGCNCGPA